MKQEEPTGHTHEKRIEQIEDELYKSLRRQLRSKSLRGKTVDKLVHVLDYVEKNEQDIRRYNKVCRLP